MKPFARQKLILDQLVSREILTIEELVELTGSSSSTIRRDIRSLESSKQVVSLQGGAIKLDDGPAEVSHSAKALLNRDKKQAIGQLAAAHVEDGQTIYVDSGTTTMHLVEALYSKKVHIVTSNTHVLTSNLGANVKVTILGGDFIPEIASVAGTLTDRYLDDLYFDKSFIGANGIHARSGVTTFDIREANKKRIVQQHSRETYVLVDSSKFNRTSLCRAFALADCYIVSDEYSEVLESAKSYIVPESSYDTDGTRSSSELPC